MSLFVVKHQHSAETCPAGNPQMAPFLVQHVSPPNAAELIAGLIGLARPLRLKGLETDSGFALGRIPIADDSTFKARVRAPRRNPHESIG